MKHVVQRSNVLVADRGPLVEHTDGGVEALPLLEEADGEGGRKRGDSEPTTGPERGGNALEGSRLVAATEEPESPLAETDDGVELAVVGELADVADLEARRQPVRGCGISGQGDEVVRQVDAHHVDPAPGECERVPAGTASDVEHPLP